MRASVRPVVSASVATRGPRSEPPMPMFTTVAKRSPVAPRLLPSCTAVTKPRMRSRSAAASFDASSMPVGERGLQAGTGRRAQRHVHGGAVLGDVDHLAGEQAAAEACQVRRLGEADQRVEHLGVDRRLGVVEREVVQAGAELMGAPGVGGEQRRDAPAVRACRQRGQPGEGGLATRWLGHGGLGHGGLGHGGSIRRFRLVSNAAFCGGFNAAMAARLVRPQAF